MTPREALASLLAVPYWVLAMSLASVGGGDVVAASRLHGWAEAGLVTVLGVAYGVGLAFAQGPLLDRAAGWVWARVEALAAAWRELTR